ncbi:DNA mismatch repair protein MutS [Paenibacillus selenitireducens]|uniref:DNA mismatch repair protein MutS n=1 Tax=Paenibacillus selenitireducens TaxID=1324314 RepID=A0A1T2X474_9BACL|nr:DNA mismatch repair protein MutS [Paenibacillus selenitireducens]OPA74701.1 DNA mismatch repair protein MutS [Paenibacillus selenitireducens]
MAKYTPMIEQYLSIKAEAQDAFLFFRLGDFYEMFFEDAILASKELEITLTGREGGAEERIPMCGIPYHSAENYIHRLIEKGYKVAICEQVEDPSVAKGIVRREIIRVITPGTAMDSKTLGEPLNNYMVCLTILNGMLGFAASDISTGELYVTSFPYSQERLLDEMNIYAPSEVIGDAELMDIVQQEYMQWGKPVLRTPWTKIDDALVVRQFGDAAWSRLEDVRRRAVSRIVAYFSETQKRSLGQLTQIRSYEPEHYLILDPFTRRNLELVETVRERAKKGTLLWLLDETETSMGARLLRRWIDKPLMQRTAIESRLEAVDKLFHQFIVREEIRTQLKEIYDLERLVSRVAFGNANGRDMIALRTSLQQIPALQTLCVESPSVTLRDLASDLDACSDVLAWIDQAVMDEPPISLRDGGLIKSGYDAHLDQLREANVNGKRWIADLERRERESTGIKTLKIGFNKVFGYYIEVTKSHIGSLPEGRYERKQTLANAERYITPELKEKESLILEAEEKMVDLEYSLFVQLRDRIAEQITRLQKLAEKVAEIDVYQSLATVSAKHRFVKPVLTDGDDLVVKSGRHPVVEAVMNGGSFIANDTKLRRDEEQILLITGPNMAGKSTYMRQVALICIMAQIGCFVPAEQAEIPMIDRIFTRIGAADDLIGGQSTFMVEMMDIQVMTEKATPRSLVIIDELGRGTSTSEGMSIAQAVIEFVHDRIGCKALVSTHFHELAHLEESLQGLRNYCMAVQENGNDVTFLRKLIPGAASTSYGIYCARLAGLPDLIIDRAYTLLQGFEYTESNHQMVVREAAVGQATEDVTGDVGQTASVPDATTQKAVEEPKGVVQLSIFDEEEVPLSKPIKKQDAKAERVIANLQAADIMNMTPLQAIQLLNELKQQLKG